MNADNKLDLTLSKLKTLIDEQDKIEKEINESDLGVELLKLKTRIMQLREDIFLLQSPIFLEDRINPNVVNRIKLISSKIGFVIQDRQLRFKEMTFNSYQEGLNYILANLSIIEGQITEEEKFLIDRFITAVNSINALCE